MKKVKSKVENLEKEDTKCRIIGSATVLFAKKGFDGTSVRDIASHATVNLAAINYHFSNKENLYKEVLRSGLCRFADYIEDLGEGKYSSTAEFAVALFDMLIKNAPSLLNNFKVMLDNFDFPEDVVGQSEQTSPYAGPPGGHVIMKAIEKEIKKPLSMEDKMWAVRVIFNHVVHTAIIASTNYGKREAYRKFFEKKVVHASIKRLVELVLKDLKSKK